MRLIIQDWIGRQDIGVGSIVFFDGDLTEYTLTYWDADTGTLEIDGLSYGDVAGVGITGPDYRGPIQQLLDVLGFGQGWAHEAAGEFPELMSPDDCPEDFLPLLGGAMGFEFPYDLEEDKRRNFIRSMVAFYRMKGTTTGLKLMVQRLVGGDFDVVLTNEDHVAKTFAVELTATTELANVNQVERKLRYLIEYYAPAGMVPGILILFYHDEEMSRTPISEESEASGEAVWYPVLNGLIWNINDDFVLNERHTETVPE
jgi:phage tail-like protein